MIHDALTIVLTQLNRALGSAGDGDAVALGNIAAAEATTEGGGGTTTSLNRVVMSLVNVTEDHTLKNGPNHRLEGGRYVYENRPVNLYLYVLFSANNTHYPTAIAQLARVITFFQGRTTFTVRNSPSAGGAAPLDAQAALRLIVELQSLTFEQVNHLWGSLGGKQVPFALYRIRLVPLSAGEIEGTGVPIEEISVDLNGRT